MLDAADLRAQLLRALLPEVNAQINSIRQEVAGLRGLQGSHDHASGAGEPVKKIQYASTLDTRLAGNGSAGIDPDTNRLYYVSGGVIYEVATGAGTGLATPAIVLGAAAAAGAATTTIRSDGTIAAFDTTAPSTQAFGDAAVVGTVAFATRRDHKHAMPADPVTAHAAAADPHTGYVLESLIDAKGDLIAGSAADTVGRLAGSGTDGWVLTYDSAEALGLKWAASGGTTRVYVTTPQDWADAGGTDYLAVFANADIVTAAVDSLLTDHGWVFVNTPTLTNGSGADFIESVDPGPSYVGGANAGMESPPIFGEYGHSLMAAEILGSTPTKLTMVAYAAFLNANQSSTVAGLGFIEDGGAVTVAADHMAWIRSDGTTFICESGAASDTGAADDTLWHLFKIVVTYGGSVEWFIDGVSQGTFAIQAEEWPVSWGIYGEGAATQCRCAWVHIFYS